MTGPELPPLDDDPTAAKWWPRFTPRRPGTAACSVCGALVADTGIDQAAHQLFHGLLWRLVIGDPNPINVREETELRGWLRAMDAE